MFNAGEDKVTTICDVSRKRRGKNFFKKEILSFREGRKREIFNYWELNIMLNL